MTLRNFKSNDPEMYDIDIGLTRGLNQKWYCQKPIMERMCFVFLYCWDRSYRYVIIKQSTVCEIRTMPLSFQKFNTTTTKKPFLLNSGGVMSLCFRSVD